MRRLERYLAVDCFWSAISTAVVLLFFLLTLRLNEWVHFLSLAPSVSWALLYLFYQILFLIPLAIPLALLVSCYLVVQRLAASREITACRAAGLSLFWLARPFLVVAALFSFVNGVVASEGATWAHGHSSRLKEELKNMNPLLLLHNKQLAREHGLYFTSLGASKLGRHVEKVLCAMLREGSREEIPPDLFTADRLAFEEGGSLQAEGVAMIRTLCSEIVVEHGDQLVIPEWRMVDLIKERGERAWEQRAEDQRSGLELWHHLSALRRAVAEREKAHFTRVEPQSAAEEQLSRAELEKSARSLRKAWGELFRRISLTVAPLFLAWLGFAAGVAMPLRAAAALYPISAMVMAGFLYVVCFFIAKEVSHSLLLLAALYSAPAAISAGLTFQLLRSVSRGTR